MNAERAIAGLTGRVVGQFGNIWIMAHLGLMKGELVPMAQHAFDHVSWLQAGSVRLLVEGKPVIYHAQNFILIEKGTIHAVEVLEDHTHWVCVHVVTDAQGLPDPTMDHYKNLLHDPRMETV